MGNNRIHESPRLIAAEVPSSDSQGWKLDAIKLTLITDSIVGKAAIERLA